MVAIACSMLGTTVRAAEPQSRNSGVPAAKVEALPDGEYACQLLAYAPGTWLPQYRPSVMGSIVLRGSTYERRTSGKGKTRFDVKTQRLTFLDGPMRGWVAAAGRNSTGLFVRLRGRSPGEPGDSPKIGDDLCFLQH